MRDKSVPREVLLQHWVSARAPGGFDAGSSSKSLSLRVFLSAGFCANLLICMLA
jgi:hypothetical protein